MLAAGIVTDALGIRYDTPSGPLGQVALFEVSGFYIKALPAIGPSAYAVVLNTNLGGDNEVQTAAMNASLAWVQAKHGDAAAVYLLGHHPSVMRSGTDYVPAAYRALVKGVFAGHIHVAQSTTDKLFTQLGAISQASTNNAFVVATVSDAAPEVRVDKSQIHSYTGDAGKVSDPSKWS